MQGGIIAAASLFIVNYILKYFLYRDARLGKALQRGPVMLIHKGTVVLRNFEREQMTLHELEAAVREHGVDSIKEVDLAVLEVDGNISVLSNNYQQKSVRKRKLHRAVNKTT